MFKQHPHTPAHLFLDNTLYFITGAIYKKRQLMNTSELKFKFIETIRDCFKEHNWELQHWVILNNHYHLMAMSGDGKLLSNIIKKIHGTSSHFIRKAAKCERPVWWNYWDYCPRDEKGYYILKPIWFSDFRVTKSWLQLYSLNFISDFIRKPL